MSNTPAVGGNNANVFIRRAAHAAIERALQSAGLPSDLFVLPHCDDFEGLDVRAPNQVLWQSRATVYFQESSYYTGVVYGDDLLALVVDGRAATFEPEAFGLVRKQMGYPFELPFDIADRVVDSSEFWSSAPFKPPFKRTNGRRYPSHAHRSIGR